jgi:hypothetical protein
MDRNPKFNYRKFDSSNSLRSLGGAAAEAACIEDDAALAIAMANSLQQSRSYYDILLELATQLRTLNTPEAKQVFYESFAQCTLTDDEHTEVMLALGHRQECFQGLGCDIGCPFCTSPEGAQAEAPTCECSVLVGDVSSYQLPHPKCKFCALEERKKFKTVPTSMENNDCLYYALQQEIVSTGCPKFARLGYSEKQIVESIKRKLLSVVEQELCTFSVTDKTDAAVAQEFAGLQDESERHNWVNSYLGSNDTAIEFAFMHKHLDDDNQRKFDAIVEEITKQQIDKEDNSIPIELRTSQRLKTQIDDARSSIHTLQYLQRILITDGEMSEAPCANAIAKTFGTKIHIYDVASGLWHVYTPPKGSWKGEAYVELKDLHYSRLEKK